MNISKQSITKIDSKTPGPTLAIIAGIHGNEITGPQAIELILPDLSILRGSLYIILANPPALKVEERQIAKNLNRCFYENNEERDYEDRRARKIMHILNSCDAMLDLHAFNEPTGKPFVMTEENGIEVAKIFDVEIISTNWNQAEPDTTDGYMYRIGKVGLCLECGPIIKHEEYTDFAKNSILQFLSYFEMIEQTVELSKSTKRIVEAQYSIVRTEKPVSFSGQFKSFDKLDPGKVFCKQGKSVFQAKTDECIIFPRPQAKPGTELFVIGRELNNTA